MVISWVDGNGWDKRMWKDENDDFSEFWYY